MDPLGIGKSIDLARELLAPVGQTLADGWGIALGDRVAAWRARNAMKYQALLAEEATRLGLKLVPNKIPDRYAFAWFEEATKQDEPEIQILFTRLLARAADEKQSASPDRRLLDILARLTPADARLFQRLYSPRPFPDTGAYSDTPGLGQPPRRGYPVDWLTPLLQHSEPTYSAVALDNLVLQGCVVRQWRLDFDRTPALYGRGQPLMMSQIKEELVQSMPNIIKQREFIDATDLGIALHTAVRE